MDLNKVPSWVTCKTSNKRDYGASVVGGCHEVGVLSLFLQQHIKRPTDKIEFIRESKKNSEGHQNCISMRNY